MTGGQRGHTDNEGMRKDEVVENDDKGSVLSHNLCTVLNVPHDPVALEEHFRDDDEGPVSNQGYMPYLNKFILEKVQGNFDKVEFNRMCWTLCAKKNLSKSPLLISDEDAFKVWVIFNFLSEDKYPLIIVPEE
ncbi:switch-associated protein 70-like, partial [Antrostomus carolinensis]|uniref:switch-associated protein 70-like n=1 Tax=Antrostomus carolinensis TaxID=279965 RepID=UPI0010A98ED0